MVCLYDVLSYTMNYNIIPLYTYCRVFMNDSTIRLTAQNDKCIDISNYGTSDGSNIWYIHHLIYSQYFFFIELLYRRLFGCHTDDKKPEDQNQEWTFNSNGTITSVISGKCMESVVEEGRYLKSSLSL